jgi:hypothetical protein
VRVGVVMCACVGVCRFCNVCVWGVVMCVCGGVVMCACVRVCRFCNVLVFR